MFPWLIATALTPCWGKNSFISRRTLGLVVTAVATQRFMIGSAPSCGVTAAAILVVCLSSGRLAGGREVGRAERRHRQRDPGRDVGRAAGPQEFRQGRRDP